MKSSKGQRVKTFKSYIPQSDLTKKETQVAVYFKADNGHFYIFDGAHMFQPSADAARKSYDSRELGIHEDMITSKTLERIVRGFDDICHIYDNMMRDAAKKKVIRFSFKANAPWYREGEAALSDINFCGSPALHLTYEVLYQVGDNLYTKSDVFDDEKEDAKLQYRGKATEARFRDGEAVTIDWTEEREAFFENMRGSLIELIHRVNDFNKNLLVNVDNAIAANSLLMLPAPKKETTDADI
jgi:hypothetical protein